MTSSIIQKYKEYRKKHEKIYPKYNLYFGYYLKKVEENGYSYTYYHYDCFLGDEKKLEDCSKFTRLTGKYPQTSFKPENKDKLQQTNTIFINDENICSQYILKGDHYIICSENSIYFFGKDERLEPMLSLHYIRRFITKLNEDNKELAHKKASQQFTVNNIIDNNFQR